MPPALGAVGVVPGPPPLRVSMLLLFCLLPGKEGLLAMVVLRLVVLLVGEVMRALLMAFCGGGERLKRILGCASSAKMNGKKDIAFVWLFG